MSAIQKSAEKMSPEESAQVARVEKTLDLIESHSDEKKVDTPSEEDELRARANTARQALEKKKQGEVPQSTGASSTSKENLPSFQSAALVTQMMESRFKADNRLQEFDLIIGRIMAIRYPNPSE